MCLLKEYKNTDLKGHMNRDVYSSIINDSQIVVRAQMPIDWGMRNEDAVCIQWNITQP